MSLTELIDKVKLTERMSRALFDLGEDKSVQPQKLNTELVESAVRLVYAHHNGEQYLPDELSQNIERSYNDEQEYLCANPFPNGDYRAIVENCTYHSLVRSVNEAVDAICAQLAHEQVIQEDSAIRTIGEFMNKLPAPIQKAIAPLNTIVPFLAVLEVDKILRDKYRKEAGECYARLDEVVDALKQKYGGLK